MPLLDCFYKESEDVKKLYYVSDDSKLKLYGLYKQATIGDVNCPRPSGIFNIKEKAKYDAWYENKDMSKETAMFEYINLVSELQQ
jgi:diazepam-binding inhibitor (GABA receptor modulating acyl-CoA-binding protein)